MKKEVIALARYRMSRSRETFKEKILEFIDICEDVLEQLLKDKIPFPSAKEDKSGGE